METNATEFRRNPFQMMDRAMRGELVEIKWRGSKLSRAVRRHALRVDPAAIGESDPRLMAQLDRKWKRDDRAL